MNSCLHSRASRGCWLLALLAACLVSGCATSAQTGALTGAGVTLLGARAPSHEIQQTYYFGVFDPQEQVPPAIYRVRVNGQASFISFMRFGSGWVRADLLDSLGSNIETDMETGAINISSTTDKSSYEPFETGRGLMLFGPEGFRPAPRNHRLVVVMGADPEAFFEAMDESLSAVSEAIGDGEDSALSQELFEALLQLKKERESLDELEKAISREKQASGGGQS